MALGILYYTMGYETYSYTYSPIFFETICLTQANEPMGSTSLGMGGRICLLEKTPTTKGKKDIELALFLFPFLLI